MLVHNIWLFCDKFAPKIVHKRLRKEFQSISLVTIVEYLKIAGPEVFDKWIHKYLHLINESLASDDPVGSHQEKHRVLDPELLCKLARYAQSLAKVAAPLGARLKENSLVNVLRKGLFLQITSEMPY